ncbi:glycerol-3-phosphate dehydrogenase/oxidase [Planotetraspora sp. GP83]|uniref:glycerol-3-phosphate dehydrogenase/oxidase n=1 Tax=Planotetraspora sp. GP83 TaxID=3156264 RepID=UPI0035193869
MGPSFGPQLGPRYRAAALRKLAEREFDVLVVGGGVVGAGAALDAVSRGLSVALVEARDLAAGTSSRSSKLIHGGLRYLEQLDFRLVREALKERGLLVNRLAPHLVRPIPFLYPLRHRVWERGYIGAGILLYDTLGGSWKLPRHRQLSLRRTLQKAPALRKDALVGSIQYYDAQVDDARFTMMVARTAARYGACVTTRTPVIDFLREGERVTGALVRDLETGAEIEVKARQVINATGVWTDESQRLAGPAKPASGGSVSVQASKGVHVVVPRDRIKLDTGLILRTEKSVLFVIPWGPHWIVGTTDTPWDLDKAEPSATHADIDYILDHVNAVLNTPLTRDDIEGVYVGLRPLLGHTGEETVKLSREHAVIRPVPGLVIVAGGKYTTYRVMAKDAVDVAVSGLGEAVPASVTERVPILGADGFAALRNNRRRLAERSGLTVGRIDHLLHRYGSRVEDLLELIEATPALAEPIPGADAYLKAEAVYAASDEGALHLEDIMVRRTRVFIEERDHGLVAAPVIAELVAPVLGWDAEAVSREIGRYREFVEADLAAQREWDDAAANAVRQSARHSPATK